jgi:hypothetical protein
VRWKWSPYDNKPVLCFKFWISLSHSLIEEGQQYYVMNNDSTKFSVGSLTTLFQNRHYIAWGGITIDERWTGKDFEGSGRGLTEALRKVLYVILIFEYYCGHSAFRELFLTSHNINQRIKCTASAAQMISWIRLHYWHLTTAATCTHASLRTLIRRQLLVCSVRACTGDHSVISVYVMKWNQSGMLITLLLNICQQTDKSVSQKVSNKMFKSLLATGLSAGWAPFICLICLGIKWVELYFPTPYRLSQGGAQPREYGTST